MRFELSDVVRVQRLTVPTREVDGPGLEPPQPRVGDEGTGGARGGGAPPRVGARQGRWAVGMDGGVSRRGADAGASGW